MSDIKEEIIDMIAEHLNYDKKKISMKSSFSDDLGADSLDSVELIMAIEEKYKISLPDDEMTDIRNVEQLIEKVKEKI